jgi:hypothetical protein
MTSVGRCIHYPSFDRFSEIPGQDDHFVQLNGRNGPSMIVLADIPFLSHPVKLMRVSNHRHERGFQNSIEQEAGLDSRD